MSTVSLLIQQPLYLFANQRENNDGSTFNKTEMPIVQRHEEIFMSFCLQK